MDRPSERSRIDNKRWTLAIEVAQELGDATRHHVRRLVGGTIPDPRNEARDVGTEHEPARRPARRIAIEPRREAPDKDAVIVSRFFGDAGGRLLHRDAMGAPCPRHLTRPRGRHPRGSHQRDTRSDDTTLRRRPPQAEERATYPSPNQ